MRSLGAEVIEFGRDFQDALEHAGRLSKESGLHFINSFNFVLVQGVASYALELFRSVPELDYIYVPRKVSRLHPWRRSFRNRRSSVANESL
jgi:threonine dehydratase